MLRLTILLLLLVNSSPLRGEVRLPRLISDGIILQRDAKIRIWGWASVDETVTLIFKQKSYSARANDKGEWVISLPAQPAGGPFEMTFKAWNEIVLHDILFGDVWICSGQSNMEQVFSRLKDKYPEVVAQSRNSYIRQFIVPTAHAFEGPRNDLSAGTWESASPETLMRFTAVGYFFAKELYDRHRTPIGLIRSAAGGTPVEAWISEGAVKSFPHHAQEVKKFQRSGFRDSIRSAESATTKTWYDEIRRNDKGLNEIPRWNSIAYDASRWPSMIVPGYWEEQGLPGVNGVVWFRKEIDLPSTFADKPVRLQLGNIVDCDSVFVNGVFSGTTGYQYPPRKYDLPAGLLKTGRNVIVVRIINTTGKGGFYKEKPYLLKAGNDTINLSGEWSYNVGVKSDPLASSTFFNGKPTVLFNAMISPLLNVSIKGVIWYQGESNTDRAEEYKKTFPLLIADWREKWKQGDFPFLYVQLANYLPAKDVPGESDWAELREAQFETLNTSNTAMVVTYDIGEWNDIHPYNKKDVGQRLALAAERLAYKKRRVVYSGPVYRSMKSQGSKIILTFDHTGSGLVARGGRELKHFSIAGPDGKFMWARATIVGNTVVVSSDRVATPVAVRYAWADNPEGANLYNAEGLPASPFRTDAFKTGN
jgi:sialate O-acetylesterase